MAVSSVSTNRLTGMSSGLDTDSIVKSMLSTYQSRIDKQNKTTTKLQWKADALRSVNSLIKTFRTNNMSVLNASTNMLSASSYKAFDVTMLTSTKAVTVTAGSSAAEGKVTINSITQLAEAAKLSSTDVFSSEINTSTKLGELSFNNDLFGEGNEISFSINDVDFTFTKDTTLNEMLSQINASSANVKMSYSSLKDGFTITSKTIGSSSSINIVNKTGNAFATENSAFGIAQQNASGKDARLKIDGYDVVKSSNTFTIDGITYTLNDTYIPQSESDTGISFTVTNNVDTVVDRISKFVDSYNELIGKLQDMIGETVYRDYTPLTDAQKEEMTEKEIEKWEEKAKSGIIRNDSNIQALLTTVRSALYTKVEGTGMSLSDIGLTTGTYTDGAKIKLDKDKLKTALENNPDAVASLFTKSSSSTDEATKFKESGLVTRISSAMLSYTKQATDISLATLDDSISDSKEAVEKLEEKMSDKSEALYKKFAAMESALSKLNSQSSWMSSLFSSSKS